MELGEKLRQARIEAGLSQRQLCGEEITRNMLSQIEHGTAKPSMKTLQYLASRLGKSISYFLEETAVVSPNQQVMESARALYDAKDFAAAVQVLAEYREPDPVYDREKQLLWVLLHLELAEQAIRQNRDIFARELLKKAELPTVYCSEALQRRRLLLLGRIRGERVSAQLPSLDAELLLRAREAFASGNGEHAAHLLEAMEGRNEPRWQLLRGELYLAEQKYREAARCFHRVEREYPKETAEKLEQCYRELEDYKQAYAYACKRRKET